jgi:cephalosporin hydroxylase
MSELNLNEINTGIGKTTYRGVGILKFPFDYVMYQMIVFEIKPDLIIEIGTYGGGSALYLADLLDILGKGEVHTIDIYPEITPAMSCGLSLFQNHPRTKYFNKGYEGYDLSNCEGHETILVIDDGTHKYEDVLKALYKFKDVVSKNSYFIVEDGNCYQLYPNVAYSEWNGGPLKAIDEFLKNNSDFIIDKKWCDFYGTNSTFNTNGYLKKIK